MCSDTCEYAERYKILKNPHAHRLHYLFSFLSVSYFIQEDFTNSVPALHSYITVSWIHKYIFSHKKQKCSHLSSWVLAQTFSYYNKRGRCSGNIWQRLFYSNRVCEMRAAEDEKRKMWPLISTNPKTWSSKLIKKSFLSKAQTANVTALESAALFICIHRSFANQLLFFLLTCFDAIRHFDLGVCGSDCPSRLSVAFDYAATRPRGQKDTSSCFN